MSGPPCGELNAFLTEKYAAIRREEIQASLGSASKDAVGSCMAVWEPPTGRVCICHSMITGECLIWERDAF